MATEYINPYELPGDFTSNGLNLYAINGVTLKRINEEIWQTEPSFWDSLTGKIQNATDCIVTLHAIPCRATYTDALIPQGVLQVSVGNKGLTVPISDGGYAYKMQRYTTLTSDTLEFKEYYATILDYMPYTKIKLFLPYSGTYDIKVSDIMNGAVKIYCVVDMLTGNLSYTVVCNTNNDEPAKNLYHFSGNCKASIPLSSSDYSRLFSNIRNGITNTATNIVGGISRGANAYGAVAGGLSALNTLATAITDYNTPDVTYTNDVSCENGWLSTQVPYFIIEHPTTHVAEQYDNYVGYPSLLTRKLSDLVGYTEIDSIHLDGLTATENEKTELEQLLKAGVIL